MGMLKNMFAQLESELDGALSASQKSSGGKNQRRASGPPPTNWEKAVIGLDKIVAQVVKVDPDGVDIVCFGGNEGADWYRNVKNTKKLEEMVNDKRPSGDCTMGAAMSEALQDAFAKDLTRRPVAILVLTACMPTDADELVKELKSTVTRLADTCDSLPLSVTFVQIGNDNRVDRLFQQLDAKIQAECAANGETFDLCDTIKAEEIAAAMAEVKGTKSSGKNGALIGAFVGAAAGVGGMYVYNKHQAKKRTKGWGGKWQVTYEGEDISILNVTDDEQGNLNIEGFPSGEPTTGVYSVPTEEEQEDENFEYTMTFKDPSGDYEIEGTIEDEHAITWSDGTRWDEMQQDGAHWSKYAAAAAGGAALTGATGYLMDKKFFDKASKQDQCDYIILMDRSEGMKAVDQ